MSCPTCGATMSCLGFVHSTNLDVRWCSHCGTLRGVRVMPSDLLEGMTHEVPSLFTRLRDALRLLYGLQPPLPSYENDWRNAMADAISVLKDANG